MNPQRILPPEVAEMLKHYVYLYVDPANGEVFYIGKGQGNRVYAHLDEEGECAKTERIATIRRTGQEPRIDILAYGLSEKEALLVEATSIDLLGLRTLTNRVSGNHESSSPRIHLSELITIHEAEPATINHKVLLVTINRLYRSDMTAEALYEATRGIWKLGVARNEVEYVMAVYQGIVREVYRVHRWFPAGTLPYRTRDLDRAKCAKRWEFEGAVAGPEIRAQYVGRSVGKGGQNPVRYVDGTPPEETRLEDALPREVSSEEVPVPEVEPAEIRHKALLLNISRLYRGDLTNQDLYEATRGVWKLGAARNEVEYAMAVHAGVVREVYRVKGWLPACTLPYQTRVLDRTKYADRWEFEGEVAAPEVRDQYVGRSVGKGGQNPVRYI